MAAGVGPEAFLRQQLATTERIDSLDLLSSISCPTTVIHGADDRLIPVEMSREMAAAIPGAQLVIIEGAGHLAFSEQPDRGASAVREFLARTG